MSDFPYPTVEYCTSCGSTDLKDVVVIERHGDGGGPFEVRVPAQKCTNCQEIFRVMFFAGEFEYEEEKEDE